MKQPVILSLAMMFLFVPILRAQTSLPPEVARHGYADTIVVNTKLISVDDPGWNTNPGNIYQGMAIKGDRIIALGTNEHIRSLADSRTKVLYLTGQTVIPGIIESHDHIFGDPAFAAQMGIRNPGVSVRVEAAKDIEIAPHHITRTSRVKIATDDRRVTANAQDRSPLPGISNIEPPVSQNLLRLLPGVKKNEMLYVGGLGQESQIRIHQRTPKEPKILDAGYTDSENGIASWFLCAPRARSNH